MNRRNDKSIRENLFMVTKFPLNSILLRFNWFNFFAFFCLKFSGKRITPIVQVNEINEKFFRSAKANIFSQLVERGFGKSLHRPVVRNGIK